MSDTSLSVHQAYDRALIRDIPQDSAADLERKLTAASEAFARRDAWPKPHERAARLYRLADLVAREQDSLALQIAREGGKPLADAKIEATRAVDSIRSAAEELRTFAGREIPMGLTAASGERWAFTTHEPRGVVAAISAFNHPLNLIVHQVAPALAVGCPVIVKPASTTPLSCVRFIELAREAGVPEAWCQTFVTDDTALAERFATDARIAFLSFIGSARVGWSLRSKLAPGTRCALEHGGAAPAIVDRRADLDLLIEPMVKGGYYHAGQVCISTQRIFVHDGICDEFVERFTQRVRALKVGDPAKPDTEVGPLILPKEVDRIESWVNEAVAAGARVTTGGQRLGDTTYAPTVLLEPPADAKVSTLEIFGPVTCVYRYRDVNDAIARANSLPYAFQSAVFSQDIDLALSVADRLDAAAVIVNDHTAFRVDWMPFAGLRQSGYGIGGIPESMKDMTHEKLIVLRRRAARD
jgi:acyl-CoA reductase-like NAD-dependent aldehyde dehydrogenase